MIWDRIFPTPADDFTSIPFTLLQEADVTLEVYALNGSRLFTSTTSHYQTGSHTINLKRTDGPFPSGNHILQLRVRTNGKDHTAFRMMYWNRPDICSLWSCDLCHFSSGHGGLVYLYEKQVDHSHRTVSPDISGDGTDSGEPDGAAGRYQHERRNPVIGKLEQVTPDTVILFTAYFGDLTLLQSQIKVVRYLSEPDTDIPAGYTL